MKEYHDSPEVQYNLVGKVAVKKDLPEIIPAPGLDSKRQWYLFHQIRDFCREDAKDLVCPKPTDPEPSSVREQEPKPGSSCSAKSVQKSQSKIKAPRPKAAPKRPYKPNTDKSDSEEAESESVGRIGEQARKVVSVTASYLSGQKTRSGRQVRQNVKFQD